MTEHNSSWCHRLSSLPECKEIPNESGTHDVFYSAICQDIPSEFNHVAEKELNETAQNKDKGLKILREFIKKENLPDVDDYMLTVILRVCKYDFKKSKTKLKKYLKSRETILSKVNLLDLKKVEKIIEHNGIGVLPFRDRHGRIVLYTRPIDMHEDYYTMDEVMCTAVTTGLMVLSLPLNTVVGMSYIGDGKFKTVSSYLALLKAYHEYMWTFLDLPIRVQRIDIVDEHFLTRWFYKVVRPFLSSKIVNRVTFFGSNVEALRKTYHPDILPEEFGGNMGPLDPSWYKDLLLDYIKKLKAESKAMKEKSAKFENIEK